MKKKRVFVRLGQGLARAKEAQAAAKAVAARQEAPTAQEALPVQDAAPPAESAPSPGQGIPPHGQGIPPPAQGAPLYMQPLYMPYMQPSAADGGAQFASSLPNMSNVRGMPSVQGVPFLMCVPDMQGRPQWIPVMPFAAPPQVQPPIQPAPPQPSTAQPPIQPAPPQAQEQPPAAQPAPQPPSTAQPSMQPAPRQERQPAAQPPPAVQSAPKAQQSAQQPPVPPQQQKAQQSAQQQPPAAQQQPPAAHQQPKAQNEHPKAQSALHDAAFTRRKNRRKKVRTALEFACIAAALFVLMELFFTLKTYDPAAAAAAGAQDKGFIALSYFGVDRNGDTSTLIGKEELRRHLAELKSQGYVTISAQEIMEDLNFKATMMTYPEKFAKKDTKFLSPKDLHEMESSTFWEMGTNGYRLAYINVFDRYDDYLVEHDTQRSDMVRGCLGRRYNHYLMDYIRDKDGVPTESERQMERRVAYDYARLRDIYGEELGYVPKAHVLMHANTGRFGNNPRVSAVNEREIRDSFPMNFNREGFVLNKRTSSLYDLTRMQPQPYWPINHLLMRINYDTDGGLSYIEGREEGRRAWELKEGALECRDETLILTTLPEGKAVARLVDIENLKDLRLEAELEGNAFGSQQIFLRSSTDLSDAVCVTLVNDQLVVTEIAGGAKRELYREKLPVILGEKILSVEEARKEAKIAENEAFARYAPSPAAANEYMGRANEERETYAAAVEDGAAPYEGRESFHRRGKCRLVIHLTGDRLSVEVDGHTGPEDLAVSRTERGAVFLGASWQGEAWSQRNLADDVYDGVFKRVRVLTETGRESKEERVLYTSEYKGWEKAKYRAGEIWDAVLRWFLEYV